MIFALIIFYLISTPKPALLQRNFKKINKLLFFLFLFNFIILSWIGGNPVTDLFTKARLISTKFYFRFLILTVSFILITNLNIFKTKLSIFE